ncbi:MAG: UbiA prenyltransferase family protein [Flavipsychrobacter sp.]|nr:UbiA prenyltransferase family protein [Flavipsychrobacter sp.]
MSAGTLNLFNIFDRDTRIHLRIPFSYYLLPVYVFGLSQASPIYVVDTLIVFVALHLFIYPGSNIYNSYMDNDTGSIGGIKNPPPVTPRLYYASIIFDLVGLALCLLAGWQTLLLMLGYVGFSKGYSWHGIRFKKYTYGGWLSVAFFQGGYTFLLSNMSAEGLFSTGWFTPRNLECMAIASILIGGSYPLTQVYQHKQDSESGDMTISRKLGVKGTFIFSGLSFFTGAMLLLHYFYTFYTLNQFYVFAACLSPVIIYFNWWFIQSMKNAEQVNYENTMMINRISATCMILCFSIILYLNYAQAGLIW